MYLVFDIGGTKTRIATSDGQTINQPLILPTPADYSLESFKQFKDQKIEALAGGIAGPLNHDKKSLENSPQLPNWTTKPLVKDLEDIFKAPVYLENDATLAGLGEATLGAGKGYSIVAYLTISTGVGGVKIVDGKIDKNVHGFEPGQMMVRDGRLGEFVSGMALEKKYGKKPEDIKNPAVWQEVEKYLAEGLNNIIVDWSPNIIVLGGGIIQSINLENIEKSLKENIDIFKDIPPIKKAELGDLNGLYGALEYLKQHTS